MSREKLISKALDETRAFNGEIWECGTFIGDMARFMADYLSPDTHRIIRLFDTFTGQPFCGPHDIHQVGSMNETSEAFVRGRFHDYPIVHICPGVMPETFEPLADKTISVANIDVDNHDSVRDCLQFIYPRMEKGGYVILDDYWCDSCPGAKIATNDFMSDKPEQLLRAVDGPQAYFIKA